jgi:hypothetical protein
MTAVNSTGRHEAPDQDPARPPTETCATETFAEELRDAIAPRTLLLVVGAALLCLAFVLSYMGAFHAPSPHLVRIAVVAPAPVAGQVVGQFNGMPGGPLAATAAPDEAASRADLAHARTSAVLIVERLGAQDRLLVASGGGASVATAVERVVTAAEAGQRRTVVVEDAVPRQAGDGQGASGFYLVIGCVLAGYLLAALLGMAKGTRPATFRRAVWRLGATVPYAVLVGLGAAAIADPVLGALTGHFGALWGIGALLVLAAATVTVGFQMLFGVLGVGVAILVFVVLGNASAGGAYPDTMLPWFWRTIGPWLINGAGMEVLRRAVYFHGADVGPRLWVLIAWAVAGTILTLVVARLHLRRAALG